MLMVSSAQAALYRVSPGDDVLAVRDEIRAARVDGRVAKDESVTIVFGPGDYVIPKTVELDGRDSGGDRAPVVWRAQKPGTVRLLGGRLIPRTAFRPTDDRTGARLDPAVRGKVLVADAAPYLVCEPQVWPDHPKGVMPGVWLYHNGRSQTVARWPNRDAADGGWYGFSNVLENCGWKLDKERPAVFEFPGNRPERWRFDEGVWVTGYLIVDWDCDTVRIASYDRATRGARLAAATNYGVGKPSWPFFRRRIFVQNLLEELDQEGEWYLDRKARMLYWWPASGDSGGEVALAQALTPYFRIKDSKNIVVENIDFAYSHGDTAIVIESCERCIVRKCSFFCHGGKVAAVSGRRNRITHCTMKNLGGTAVTLDGGSVKDLLPANNVVEHCRIENISMYKRTASPGIVLSGCGNAVRDSALLHSPDKAMQYSGNEHLIADNEFGFVTQEAGDTGCIYSGYHPQWLGTIIFGNYFHDLARTPVECDSRSAVYFDDCDWGDDVIGNTFRHAGRSVVIGGGKLHNICNNLVSESYCGLHIDARGNLWRAKKNGSFYWNKEGRPFCRYRFAEDGLDPELPPYSVVYPDLREAMENHPEFPYMNIVTGNVFAACKEPFAYSEEAKLALGPSTPGNTVVAEAADASARAPQPIRIKDAVQSRLASADGSTKAFVGLDETAHLVWALQVDGRRVLELSPLGITVGSFDLGRRVVPEAAQSRGEVTLPPAFTNATVLVPSAEGAGFRSWAKDVTASLEPTVREWRIPLRSLLTGERVAFVDFRLWKGGAAYRWTVPGSGRRRVAGENDSFVAADQAHPGFTLVEWERDSSLDNGYPEVFYYRRAEGVTGVLFPEATHGWMHVGDVVSPWRGVLCR